MFGDDNFKVGRFIAMHGVSDKGGYTSACVGGVVVFVEGFTVFNVCAVYSINYS